MANDGTVTAPDGSGRQVKLITADDVVAYLKAHPTFFAEHTELAEELALVPRVQGPGVIDMQQAILKRFRSEIDKLKTERTEIIANSKQNQIVQNRVQAAVISITECLAAEWGPSQVRVNAVSPGYTRTPALQGAIDKGQRDINALKGNSALGRMVEPDEIAKAVAFLAGPDAEAITGVNLPVDCGWLVTPSWPTYGGLRAPSTGHR